MTTHIRHRFSHSKGPRTPCHGRRIGHRDVPAMFQEPVGHEAVHGRATVVGAIDLGDAAAPVHMVVRYRARQSSDAGGAAILIVASGHSSRHHGPARPATCRGTCACIGGTDNKPGHDVRNAPGAKMGIAAGGGRFEGGGRNPTPPARCPAWRPSRSLGPGKRPRPHTMRPPRPRPLQAGNQVRWRRKNAAVGSCEVADPRVALSIYSSSSAPPACR
jgi:hypothetical protein